MLNQQKALLTTALQNACRTLSQCDVQRWFVAFHVVMKIANAMMSYRPKETIEFLKQSDTCLPGEEGSGEKFIQLSKDYLNDCRVWLENQNVEEKGLP